MSLTPKPSPVGRRAFGGVVSPSARESPSYAPRGRLERAEEGTSKLTGLTRAAILNVTGGAQIDVFVRMRPLTATECQLEPAGSVSRIQILEDKKRLSLFERREVETFEFNRVFSPQSTQEDLYETVMCEQVEYAVKGQSSCVFAYGQTGSGKTYTAFGNLDNPRLYGLIPRTGAALLEALEGKWGTGARELAQRLGLPPASSKPVLRMSILECYNEELSDLLFPSGYPGGCSSSSSSSLSPSGEVHILPFSRAMEIIREEQAEAVRVATATAKAAEREGRRTAGARFTSPEPSPSSSSTFVGNSQLFTPLNIGEHPTKGTIVSPSNSVEVSGRYSLCRSPTLTICVSHVPHTPSLFFAGDQRGRGGCTAAGVRRKKPLGRDCLQQVFQ